MPRRWSDLARQVRQIGIETFKTDNPVSYFPQGQDGAGFEIEGVYTNEHVQIDTATPSSISSTKLVLGVDLGDFDTPPLPGDTCEIEGVMHRVVDVQPDGQGGADLVLHKD